MPEVGRSDRERRRSRRRPWMALLFLLLPAVVAAGLIAPELVAVAPAQEQDVSQVETPTRPVGPTALPLLVERDFSVDGGTPLLDLQDLFRGASLHSGIDMVAFPQNRGELIPVDDVSSALPEPVFEDLLADPLIARSLVPRGESLFALINPIPRTNGLRFDDFPGGGNGAGEFTTPIPEPGTGLLLAGGLALLGVCRRRPPC